MWCKKWWISDNDSPQPDAVDGLRNSEDQLLALQEALRNLVQSHELITPGITTDTTIVNLEKQVTLIDERLDLLENQMKTIVQQQQDQYKELQQKYAANNVALASAEARLRNAIVTTVFAVLGACTGLVALVVGIIHRL